MNIINLEGGSEPPSGYGPVTVLKRLRLQVTPLTFIATYRYRNGIDTQGIVG